MKEITEEPKTYEIEQYKNNVDYLKHLTTLSTGSIVLIGTFIDKFSKTQKVRVLVAVSLAGFLLSVIGFVVGHTLALFAFPGDDTEISDWVDYLGSGLLIAAGLGFLVGVVSLGIYVIVNLYE